MPGEEKISSGGGEALSPPPMPPPAFTRDGQLNSASTGLSYVWMVDIYHEFLRISWARLLLLLWVGYLLVNALFTGLYLLGGACVSGVAAGDVVNLFWFSVQTLSTIGYGGMSPTTHYAHFVATVESFVGLVAVAMGTGLMFAKFSRPTARVAFSEAMVVHSHNGVPCLMFRMANERSNQIVEARLHLSALMDEVTREGARLRRFYTLRLERQASPTFALSWLAIHPLDEASPLHGLTPDTVAQRLAAIMVTFTGIDDTFAQNVHARTAYMPDQIVFNHRFEDMMGRNEDGRLVIHYENLHRIVPLDPDDVAAVTFT